MRSKPRRLYKPSTRRQAAMLLKSRRNGITWGRWHFQIGALPGMEITLPPDEHCTPRQNAHWEAFSDGLMRGYLDAASSQGLTIQLPDSEKERQS